MAGRRRGKVCVALRDRLRRLERLSEDKMIVIPQEDGTVKRFPPDADREAFTNLSECLGEKMPRQSTRC